MLSAMWRIIFNKKYMYHFKKTKFLHFSLKILLFPLQLNVLHESRNIPRICWSANTSRQHWTAKLRVVQNPWSSGTTMVIALEIRLIEWYFQVALSFFFTCCIPRENKIPAHTGVLQQMSWGEPKVGMLR